MVMADVTPKMGHPSPWARLRHLDWREGQETIGTTRYSVRRGGSVSSAGQP